MAGHFDSVAMLAVRWLLMLVFAAAVWHKLADFAGFRDTLRDYRLIPASLAGPAALGLAVLELTAIVTLAGDGTADAGLMITSVLLLVYSLAIGINLARGRRHIDCGCGGLSASQPIGPGLILRNVALAGLAALAMRPSAGLDLALWDIGLAAVTALAAALLHAAVGELLANAPKLAALGNRHE